MEDAAEEVVWGKIIEILRESYPGDAFPESVEQARNHEVGDTLADFILLECCDVIDGADDLAQALDLAIKAMLTAQDDLASVLGRLARARRNVRGTLA